VSVAITDPVADRIAAAESHASVLHGAADTEHLADEDAGPDTVADPHPDTQEDLALALSARSRRLTAIVACTDDSGRVLLVKQIGGPYAGAWLLPGGGVDEGESIEEGLRREMREETGLELDEITRVATYEVDERTQDFKALVHLFRATARGQARAEDGSAIRWASPTEAGYHPALRRELADAGLRIEDDAALDQALRATNVTMRRG
jgi:8-oxo-dGTP diphosphatase